MLRILTALFAIVAAASGYYAWQQHGEAASLRDRLAALESERDAARKAEAAAQKEVEPLKENNARLVAERDAAKKQAREVAAATPNPGEAGAPKPDSGKADGLKGFAKMFESEEGKKMMKAQIGMVTKLQYGDLAKALKLSPQEAEQVMAMLGDRAADMAGDPFKLMNGDMDEASLKKFGEETEAKRKSYDEKLKAILGDEKFKQMQDYDKSLGDRMMMAQTLDPQFASSGSPLQPAQRDQLLQIMSEERKKMPPAVFDMTGKDTVGNMRAMSEEGTVDKWLEQEKKYHENVLKSATTVLAPEQINAMQQGFQQSTDMQKFGIKMWSDMMKKKGGAAPASAPK